jgi:hypothetical protein
MGVAAITAWFKKQNTVISASVAGICLLVPIQMVSQTWDDHDRSGRYACRDFGQNYLNSISQDKNPVIFTCGDNDTFPLWYNQEVEGVRTDARVCNLSYLHTDWYIDQMRRPAYDSPSLPISWNRIDYAGKANDYVYVKPEKKEMIKNMYAQDPEKYKKALGENPFEVKNIMKYWVRNQDERVHYIPTDTLYIRIDKEAVYRSGMLIPREYRDTMPEYMVISLKGRDALARGDLMLLEMLSEANWERPLYMSRTVGDDNYLASLQNFFVTEGLASRITPFDWKKLGYSNEYETIVDTEKVYDNVMNRFKFGGLAENPDYYLDETTMRMVYTHRVQLASLAERLIVEGKKEKALEVLEYAEKMIPGSLVPHSTQMGAASMGSSYILLGEKSKAMSVIKPTCNDLLENIQWYESLSNRHQRAIMSDYGRNLNQLLLMTEVLSEGGDAYKEEVKRYKAEFNKHYSIWKAKQQGKRS